MKYNIVKFGQNFTYVENCVSSDLIEKVLSLTPYLDFWPSRYGDKAIIDYKDHKEIFNSLKDVFYPIMMDHLLKSGKDPEEYHFYKDKFVLTDWYPKQKISLHIDSWREGNKCFVPSLSSLIYLTEDYLGGDLQLFEDKKILIGQKAGSCIVFNSDTVHKVTTLKQGKRVTVEWFLMRNELDKSYWENYVNGMLKVDPWQRKEDEERRQLGEINKQK
jgi:2OG-Fe(II) oxygenase superfamily